MTDDIVAQLREEYEYFWEVGDHDYAKIVNRAADEIERLRKWASYEHAGYCSCAGNDKNCVNKAYETFRHVFDV